MKSPITTHILDTSRGNPAAGVRVNLESKDDSGTWLKLATGVTDADGRIGDLLQPGHVLSAGTYRLVFETGAYFSASGTKSIFPAVIVMFDVDSTSGHYHIPLLLSPFGYSTYRGS